MLLLDSALLSKVRTALLHIVKRRLSLWLTGLSGCGTVIGIIILILGESAALVASSVAAALTVVIPVISATLAITALIAALTVAVTVISAASVIRDDSR